MAASTNELVNHIVERLCLEQGRLSEAWRSFAPQETRFITLDNVLPSELCQKVYESFPKGASDYRRVDNFREKKSTLATLDQLPTMLRAALQAYQDPMVVAKIAEITGIQSLEADPSHYAGGVSCMTHGDFLNPHIDNSHDGNREKYRRLNVLYYSSPEWDIDRGGNLELWDRKVEQYEVVRSRFNRLVIMETNRRSWHSVSAVNSDRPRCCVSNYYFSRDSPSSQDYYHVTTFQGRPNQRFLRGLSVFDNMFRQLASQVLGLRRRNELRDRSTNQQVENKIEK